MKMAKSGSRSPKRGNRGGGGEGKERLGGGERIEKFSRSTVACNGCRMRKQKCGGEKPICLRCRTLRKPCVWPEQLKRGPSKGYNESLELRLREMEAILLAFLGTASDAQLSSLNAFDILDGEVAPSAAEKKQKLEEWANFPLRTGDDVVRWRDERIGRERQYGTPMDRGLASVEPRMDIGESGGEMMGGDMDMDPGEVDGGMDQGMENMDGVAMEGLGSLASMSHMQSAHFENYLPTAQESVHSSASTVRSPSSGQGNGMLGLSKEFQDTFLW